MVAPSYFENSYVDHALSANLDSSYAFEGPEKLLEIWLWESENHIPKEYSSEGLRSILLERWVEILDLVNCKILSMKSSKYMDAYLLSESSLFVFPHKIILKTCGTTTTLACLDKVFEVINEDYFKNNFSFKSVDAHQVFYSRRSFMFPDKQIHVHKDWKHEIYLLNKYFKDGKSYIVGDFNSDDHWYLYKAGNGSIGTGKDQTFEILMTELDPQCASQFVTTRKPGADSLYESDNLEGDLGHDLGFVTMKDTKLDSLFEPNNEEKFQHKETFDFIHDAFSFSPCGFSSNSISSQNGGFYYTLHITPESGWSYASFETNYPFSSTSQVCVVDILVKILEIFKPGKFSTTLINDDSSEFCENILKLRNCNGKLGKLGYEKRERVLYDLNNNYELLYLYFVKKD